MSAAVPCCPVSQEPYEEEGPNRPRTLPCGHSISHASLTSILEQPDAFRRQCPYDRTPLRLANASDYPTNYAIVDILQTLPRPAGVGVGAADKNGISEAAVVLPPPTQGVLPVAPDLEFAQVMPGGQAGGVTAASWRRVEECYKLQPGAIEGKPSNWDVFGWTAAGHCVYRGFMNSDGARKPVAICYAATLENQRDPRQGGHTAGSSVAQSHDLQAAVLAHVAFQLLPDVRPLLPHLYGYMLTPADAAQDGARPADETVWLVYSVQGSCLACHLEQQPSSTLPAKLVVALLRQLASALEALHRNNLTTSMLYPVSMFSVRMDTVDTPSAIRIAPYARELPADEGGNSYTDAFQALCTPPEEGQGDPNGVAADAFKADVWRAAAVAGVALAGGSLQESINCGSEATSQLLIDEVGRLRQDAAQLPREVADILQGCLQRDPEQRWTASHMHAALLAECLDIEDEDLRDVHGHNMNEHAGATGGHAHADFAVPMPDALSALRASVVRERTEYGTLEARRAADSVAALRAAEAAQPAADGNEGAEQARAYPRRRCSRRCWSITSFVLFGVFIGMLIIRMSAA